MSYRPLATGIAIVAAYGMAVLGLSYHGRRLIGARLWRKAHRFTIVFWALAVGHAASAGTDASTPWMRAILAASVAAITVLFVLRVLGSRRRPARAPAPARRAPALEASR
jgi:DMSO/TMAO reductase YedYZ heme-binding membrane subunit